MRHAATLALGALIVLAACASRPDPRVQAARDFQQTAYGLIAKDEQQAKKLGSLRLGMSDQEVLQITGPPTRRQTLAGGEATNRELWTYGGELKQLGTLTFEEQKLVQIQVE